jgi:DNA-binding XRE family transcriptional regulator
MTHGIVEMSKTAPKPLEFNLEKFKIDSLIFRNENDLSREQMGMLISETYHSITAYECKRTKPKVDTFYNVCRLMNKNPEEYFK